MGYDLISNKWLGIQAGLIGFGLAAAAIFLLKPLGFAWGCAVLLDFIYYYGPPIISGNPAGKRDGIMRAVIAASFSTLCAVAASLFHIPPIGHFGL